MMTFKPLPPPELLSRFALFTLRITLRYYKCNGFLILVSSPRELNLSWTSPTEQSQLIEHRILYNYVERGGSNVSRDIR